ncbi:hypothetical protein [Cohnella sp. AR92]|uniref:hypothetical protein n=1 Tax=Cohnella sp. AR92 TaxID=648716 RepID=UPI000F8E0542|nr:hypothetical protein [Cohnella sp. AR92]RUS47600.1 hypothetical protein ELR57_07360 [Cohnella sp. AR92]
MDSQTEERVSGSSAAESRKTYYVAVGAGQIQRDKEAAPFEFAIRANEEELNKLQEAFEELAGSDEPAMRSANAETSQASDRSFKKVYRKLYELGTEETKRHIESNGILD